MTDRANQAAELAESLRAMRRNARMHYSADGKQPQYAIVLSNEEMLDLTEAAVMLNLAAAAMAELAEWRSVFGHLGATPDDCGNAINSKRLDMQDEISRLSAELIPLANAAAPIEREMLTDAHVERAQDALYGKVGA